MKFVFKRKKDQFKLTKELEAKYLEKWPWLNRWVKIERIQFYFGAPMLLGGLLSYSGWLIVTDTSGGSMVSYITHLPLLIAIIGGIYYSESFGLYMARKKIIQKAEEGEV